MACDLLHLVSGLLHALHAGYANVSNVLMNGGMGGLHLNAAIFRQVELYHMQSLAVHSLQRLELLGLLRLTTCCYDSAALRTSGSACVSAWCMVAYCMLRHRAIFQIRRRASHRVPGTSIS